MQWRYRIALLALTMIFGLTPQASANAVVPATFCDTHAYTYVVKNYLRGGSANPLRCGGPTWGFRHITDRWTDNFDKYMTLTFMYGEQAVDKQGDGGSDIYELFDSKCVALFRIIYNSGAYNGVGVRPQGVITGYFRIPGPTVLPEQTMAIASYRTDCPIYQGI